METVLTERADGVVHVTLNRPEVRNALNTPMLQTLLEIFADIESRDSDRVVVLGGAGGAFCAGADLAEAKDNHARLVRLELMNRVVLSLHRLSAPTIAKVDGAAAGGGASLALGCDLVVASDRAVLSLAFVQRALSVDMGCSWLLPRLVGVHRARELAFFGDRIPAAAAVELGLVNRAVPVGELDGLAATWAGRLAASPCGALQHTKRLLTESFGASMETALAAEAAAQADNIASADAEEARNAFREKRTPVFR